VLVAIAYASAHGIFNFAQIGLLDVKPVADRPFASQRVEPPLHPYGALEADRVSFPLCFVRLAAGSFGHSQL
jgi:hypothetical protein